MTYVKLEDVLRNIKWHNADWILEHLIEDINSLPSIDPEAMIESIKIPDWYTTWNTRDFEKWYNQAIQELLQKFKS